ncbi:WecB/TagA/CpsF family glycosyltransferase [Arthrobacter sp. CDRTa11]|uniref:WecB/TagA/CpsF family glycosyltransferase n=1 Tax=Arthrobacter sp. CDRTa11 TaxID=2651199 RepID=UPI0022659D1E|nr:WecB/TagA/CpsF family glycosyltransferase [Arthrobacter sp. CDRTa11]
MRLGGVPVTLLEAEDALEVILERARNGGRQPLAVASANLDHVKHFGQDSRWEATLDLQAAVEWFTLLDGSPLVSQAAKLTMRKWPRLSGSDLIKPILNAAETAGLRVGFIGGTPQCHGQIREKFARDHPDLMVAGWWAPERTSLTDPIASRALAAEILEARTDILVVCLGKPRQELWISEFGHLTGAKVMLAFGAVVDFLAGRIRRAPARVSNLGLEWAWRLALEPRRLARRYLLDGPEAYLKLRRNSGITGEGATGEPILHVPIPATGTAEPPRREEFSSHLEHTDVAVLIVTYNSENDLPLLLQTLRAETRDQSIKVIVADNSPTPSTLLLLKHHANVYSFATGGNLGYSGGINAALAQAGTAEVYLVLNPDMRVERGSIQALRTKMALTGAGVVVPLLLDDDGSVYPSLRREPGVFRALGDALMGSRLPGRPGWLSEMDFDGESYRHPHRVDWATGAALLIRPDILHSVGQWDESFFLYSEETDFLRRVREAGASVWFEPRARMRHCRGGSGSSPALDALMAINRIRYIRKFHSRSYARAFRAVVVLSALLRSPRRQGILAAVSREKRWAQLPQAARYGKPNGGAAMPAGAVIIPAHNEAAVIGRTLECLAPFLGLKDLEVVVACNGCTDETAAVASSFPGVKVLSIPEASKVAALNAADNVATRWPRLYLDADIDIPESAISTLFECLDGDGLLAARPTSRYVTDGASFTVRCYYRARQRIPSTQEGLWGAGSYALTEEGHRRLGTFPEVTADDFYVDGLFKEGEKRVIPTEPVRVRTPQTGRSLLATLRRVYRGNTQLDRRGTRSATASELLRSVHGPVSAFDACVYAAYAGLGRVRPRTQTLWERDESSRSTQC